MTWSETAYMGSFRVNIRAAEAPFKSPRVFSTKTVIHLPQMVLFTCGFNCITFEIPLK